MSWIFRRVLEAFELNVESWYLACVTIKPFWNHQKRHQEPQHQSGSYVQCPLSLQQCHRSLGGFLKPLNSMWNAEIWHVSLSNHIEITKNVIRNLSTNQEATVSSQPPAMSSIFRGVLDALKLNVESWDLAYVTIKPYWNKQKYHQKP